MSIPLTIDDVSRPPRQFSEQQPTRQRATDQEIQKWISRQHGFRARERMASALQRAVRPRSTGNRAQREFMPGRKIAAIKQAFRRFGIL